MQTNFAEVFDIWLALEPAAPAKVLSIDLVICHPNCQEHGT
jgi:hypothetical protein